MKGTIIKLLRLLRLYKIAKNLKRKFMTITPMHILHKREMLKLYSQFINEGDLCFDIGANLGNRTEIFLRLGAKVVAVEPQLTCIQQLRKKFKKNERVTLIMKALGEKSGEAELMVSNAHILSSLSEEWIDSVKSSGRFSDKKWDKTVTVQLITLDELIEKYGKPVFCKIDVEGYEYNVLKGLSQPIKTISFEFTPEFIESVIQSIKYLTSLGEVRFNYSIGESMRLALVKYVKPKEMCNILLSLPDKTTFGDVYAKFI